MAYIIFRDINCENCAILTARPLNRSAILKIKAKELQLYLANQHVNTKGCIGKDLTSHHWVIYQ